MTFGCLESNLRIISSEVAQMNEALKAPKIRKKIVRRCKDRCLLDESPRVGKPLRQLTYANEGFRRQPGKEDQNGGGSGSGHSEEHFMVCSGSCNVAQDDLRQLTREA
ncbi:hypothetical protein HYFRA_00004452 [Hymenoscyphus fraxineus]|uniref:Uncharacterized protein n=1 Tax=Hymenoscyphus fraxineus TaxID=746836 RepID=A0A9N9KZY8_9HELO|nr:hypothetical protein HYFRA_00004452 [Hymenoscyphus fraxineus]